MNVSPVSISAPSAARSKTPPVGLIALLLKFGPKLGAALLKFGKSLKLGKAALAVTYAGTYSYLFSWQFAAILMTSLFIHESGHIWAMKRHDMPTKGIYFIPFVGGAAVASSAFPSRKAEVVVALMGPIWGYGVALASAILYIVTQNPLWAGASAWIALVNLLNLLPINPLDGGRVFKSIAFSIHSRFGLIAMSLGAIGAAVACVILHIPLLAFVALIGVGELLAEARRRTPLPSMQPIETFFAFSWYAVLAGMFVTLMSTMNHIPGATEAFNVLFS